ncbi:hypothetical protein A2276_03535 [candidate division WOR-1 bacterium RIFOXYA12_FULL_43_27]|uniref:NADH:quinone oxidoreductase/Mrp antiporter membrane subunit domain-containing protein n=1 Tax=candidate division WOR-1 bacterium RIFOXYC2_FULL_46_14 TaxID=1802587 RepID=A0A1F4U7G0_UNCSA|nr:MAG: hypothetical protein A2276_03535 [candidate division WOR-1 bacterium RIFOXYA12_FULL_43_27]OGC19229.1 MAG: hypothetical protein A2292_00800 [candidate division WOR-1 bacterium RIFOXYB2_FULL_46_45]OGC30218.1 MAG: hypothetical protein A2232_00800 [candidate division WOR-1 bacterium RIFOXYA2_FULL_46_56]OGC40819.1 MAG: hypothetical protein A2438_00800 [candidate division WOR-1 bacterium RIFOXYC2_FULL_46_14]
MELTIILAVPLILSAAGLFVKKNEGLANLNCLGYLLSLIFSISAGYRFLSAPGSLSVDGLSLFFVFTISTVAFAAALYSGGYIEHEISRNLITKEKARLYYPLFNLFVFAMLLVTTVNNLGLMWVAIEITTLVSAFLVGFHNNKNSVEAAWKYIIICSVGITLALLGTILFSYAFVFSTGAKSLNWTELFSAASRLNPEIVKIAFIFIIIGYGTKAGLAPMHTWLPDAHSQALSPISALLSGVLLKTSIYAILRYGLIADKCLGGSYVSHLLILFGMLSLLVSAGLVLVQKDIKRLLAYSSIEHIGIIALGFGIGGPIGTYGALLHMFNHAVTKSLLFFGVGNIVNVYGSRNIRSIRGALRALPFSGLMVTAGIFALAGFPPFSIFFSEMMILLAAFSRGYAVLGCAMLFFIVIIFGAVIYYFSQVLFGEKPKNIVPYKEPLPGRLAFLFLLVFILVSGWAVPVLLDGLIRSVLILKGI